MATSKIRMGVLAGAGIAAAMMSAQAKAVSVYSTGFETSEGFSSGNLVGQTGGTPALKFAVAPTPSPTSISAAVTGGKAVLTATNLSANPGNGTGDAASYYPSIALGSVNTTVNPIVTVSTTLAVTASGGTFPGFGLSLFGASSPTQNPILSVYEEGDGSIIYQGNEANATNPATPLLTGTNTFTAQLNYQTGTYSINVTNGVSTLASYTGTFNAAAGFGGAGLSAATFDNVAGASGTGTFDNFSITAVPEPTTASLVVGGLAVAGLRRRRAAR